jgi:hypothetical protein
MDEATHIWLPSLRPLGLVALSPSLQQLATFVGVVLAATIDAAGWLAALSPERVGVAASESQWSDCQSASAH